MKAAGKRIPLFDTNDDQTLRIQGELATKIGFNESVVLMQLEFLISISNHVIQEKAWTWQTLEDLKSKYFPWWSIATISRTLKSLEGQGLIFIDSFNKRKGDKTQWFALNFDKILELGCVKLNARHPIFQNAKWYPDDYKQGEEVPQEETPILQDARPIFHNEKPILQDETALPEITPEITTKDDPNGIGGEIPPPKIGPKTQVSDRFTELTNLVIPTTRSGIKFWWGNIGEILKLARGDPDLACKWEFESVKYMQASHLTITSPKSIVGLIGALASGQTLQKASQNGYKSSQPTKDHRPDFEKRAGQGYSPEEWDKLKRGESLERP